ncbi:hypothetical protein Tco_0822899 [Tanacetum coccineum]|uniref:Uncharacterized protein n=1 Tax=Tanacetum coccineum TaxID=301880 RepID=A0ABQ5AGD5_9ASTR
MSFPAGEQPLPPVDSPTTKSPRYVTESDPEEDPEEYEDDETEDSMVDYPMDGGDDGDDDDGNSSGDDADDEDEGDEDEEEEKEHIAPADSAIIVPVDEPDYRRPQASISLPPEAEVERLLAMTTPSPSPPILLSPPSAGERLIRSMAPPAHHHIHWLPSPLLPSYGVPTKSRHSEIASHLDSSLMQFTAASPSPPLPHLPLSLTYYHLYEVKESSTARPTRGQGIDYGFVSTVDAEERRQGIRDVGYGIRDTWVDPAEAVLEIAPMTVGEVNTRVMKLAELHEHDIQDLYALLEDAQDSRSCISQRVDMATTLKNREEKMLQGIDREDLEVLWRIVKAKHNDTRLEDEFERVLWGDLKVVLLKFDVEVTLVNEQHNEDLMFDTGVLDDDEVFVDVASSEKNEQSTKLDDSTAGEAVTTASVEDTQEKRNRPPTKAQKRTQMSTYLKHMGGYTYKQLKGKSFDEIQKLFDKEMKRVNTFVAMGSEVQESKEKKEEGREETTKWSRKKMFGKKRAGKEQQKESSKKKKVEEEKESEEVDEAELKKILVIKKDEDIAIDAIPLSTKLLVIVDYKLHKEGMMVYYQLIRADGSSKRYSLMIKMLQGIDREDLEVLWRIVKAKHNDTRLEDEFERVLWGDLKVVFEPDTTSNAWRMLQGYRVTIWKLIHSSGVHFVRFDNFHIFMLVEKRYPLTPITITNMLNKKLQTDHQNEMCYQLLKLMVK